MPESGPAATAGAMRVLLVHGLGRTPLSMVALRRRLRRAGMAPESFGYAPWLERYAGIRDRLFRRLAVLDRGGPWAAVGHSLGGLLLRDALGRSAPRHLVRLIMLGTPNQPPRLAPRARRVAPFRWLAGECGARLAAPEFFTELPAPAYPCAVLAGTRGIYGRLSPFGGEPNDGIVALSETRLGTEHPVLRFPVTHTFMMNDRQVQRTVVELLQRADPPGGEP